jgi:hypothetical protein
VKALLLPLVALALGASAGAATWAPRAVVAASVAARTSDPTYGHCTLWRFEDRTNHRTGFLSRCGGESHAATLSRGDLA